jgi:hypothetical protein
MASWNGTDIFMEKYQDKENIGGYFSYIENDTVKCVFFSRDPVPGVIGTILFDTTYNLNKTICNLIERDFTANELELYTIRTNALKEVVKDTLYKFYEDMSINLIPIIHNGKKKVYALTGPKKSGVVIFGNDLLLECDNQNNIVSKRLLHKNIIPISFINDENEGKEIFATVHSHLQETGYLITPTDICTLMLYEKFAKWKIHIVLSDRYASIWNCEKDELEIISRKEFDKRYNQNDE